MKAGVTKSIVLPAVCAVLIAAVPIAAHHSFSAEYDATVMVTLKGVVSKVEWSNPHVHIYVDVKDESGKVTNWALETGAANNLIRRGWRKENLPAGTVLKVEGWQARNGSPTANISSVTFEDGTRLFAGSSNQQAPQQ